MKGGRHEDVQEDQEPEGLREAGPFRGSQVQGKVQDDPVHCAAGGMAQGAWIRGSEGKISIQREEVAAVDPEKGVAA